MAVLVPLVLRAKLAKMDIKITDCLSRASCMRHNPVTSVQVTLTPVAPFKRVRNHKVRHSGCPFLKTKHSLL